LYLFPIFGTYYRGGEAHERASGKIPPPCCDGTESAAFSPAAQGEKNAADAPGGALKKHAEIAKQVIPVVFGFFTTGDGGSG